VGPCDSRSAFGRSASRDTGWDDFDGAGITGAAIEARSDSGPPSVDVDGAALGTAVLGDAGFDTPGVDAIGGAPLEAAPSPGTTSCQARFRALSQASAGSVSGPVDRGLVSLVGTGAAGPVVRAAGVPFVGDGAALDGDASDGSVSASDEPASGGPASGSSGD
jgi:hypothetical protein